MKLDIIAEGWQRRKAQIASTGQIGEMTMATISKVAGTLNAMRNELLAARDNEISMASECLAQYVTDHNDKDAWRENERTVNRLAKAWDKMIAKLDKWQDEASAIEASADNFYGD